MNLDRLAERARRPFWRPSWNSPLPITFSPWRWFQWIPWPQKPSYRHQRVRRPSWTPSWITPFCPTSGMSTQVFFNLLWVPYTDQESKLGDIWLHTGPPSAPGLYAVWRDNNAKYDALSANFAISTLAIVKSERTAECCHWRIGLVPIHSIHTVAGTIPFENCAAFSDSDVIGMSVHNSPFNHDWEPCYNHGRRKHGLTTHSNQSSHGGYIVV